MTAWMRLSPWWQERLSPRRAPYLGCCARACPLMYALLQGRRPRSAWRHRLGPWSRSAGWQRKARLLRRRTYRAPRWQKRRLLGEFAYRSRLLPRLYGGGVKCVRGILARIAVACGYPCPPRTLPYVSLPDVVASGLMAAKASATYMPIFGGSHGAGWDTRLSRRL